MKRYEAMQTSQLETAALFLEEHPGFSPELLGPDALVRGFRMGGCFLSIAEMEKLIAAKPHFEIGAALPITRTESWRSSGNPLSDLHHDPQALPKEACRETGRDKTLG
jgi:hypothetical protein